MLVVIKDSKIIPQLGRGPFNEPIRISESLYRSLIVAGYHVFQVSDTTGISYNIDNDRRIAQQAAQNEQAEKERQEAEKNKDNNPSSSSGSATTPTTNPKPSNPVTSPINKDNVTPDLKDDHTIVVKNNSTKEEIKKAPELDKTINFDTMTKAQLKRYIISKGGTYKYHDTLSQLRDNAKALAAK